LARNPVLQLRYRGEGMAHVSVRLHGLGDVVFSETPPHAAARTVRGCNPGVSERWQTWTGLITDNLGERPFDSASLFTPGSLTLQSGANQDQTGRYSTISVDDMVAGPAVGPKRPLRITPRLFDLDGDGFVEWTILPGMTPYVEGTNAPARPWQRVQGGAPVDVPFEGLDNGVHHVLFRPASPRGPGTVADVPFLLDDQAPLVLHDIESVPGFGNGTRLNLRIGTQGGSLPRFQDLKAFCDDTELDLAKGGTRIVCEGDATVVRINWPALLRRQIQKASDGATLQFRIEGLADGAGNVGEPAAVPIPIRFADDKTPPTLQNTALPSNIAWMVAWHEPIHAASFRTLNQAGHRMVPAHDDEPPVLQIDVGGNEAFVVEQFQRAPWNPDRFPLLALRVGFAKLPPTTSPATLTLTLIHRVGEAKPVTASTELFVAAETLPPEFSGTVNWTAGGVSELVINVRDLLRRLSDGKTPGQIVGLRFDFGNAAGAQFQIHHATIFAPWGPDDEFELRAYDASGMGGVAWQDDGHSDGLQLKPAQIDLPANDAAWLRLRVRDRAGNATPALHIPALRAGQPLPGGRQP
jgi:hypothetical protein